MKPLRFFALTVLAACASEPRAPMLVTPTEKACGQEATAFIKERHPEIALDEAGIPTAAGPLDSGYVLWATLADRCMKRRGAY